MSKETIEFLAANTLIGYTDKRGHAWHWREGGDNHYPGPIPVEDVRSRLFNWTALEGEITATALTPDGVLTVKPADRKAIMRSDTGDILGIFKSGYQVHQYDEWLVRNVENLLDADLAIGSAGLLSKGGRAWVQVEMADTAEIHGVEYRPFLTAATSLDGSLATTYLTGNQVVVCDNTLAMALGQASERIKIRHSRNSLGRITEVREALSIVHQVSEAFAESVDSLVNTKVTDDQWTRFLDAYCNPGKNPSARAKTMADTKRSMMQSLYAGEDERSAPWAGSAWGVVAAANTYRQHYTTVRGATRAERNASDFLTGKVESADTNVLRLLETVA